MRNQSLYRIVFVLMILVLFWDISVGIYDYFIGKYSYKDDVICEWLINYEGGFVRRGLIGQLLYWIYQICPYSVSDVIVYLFFLGTGLLTVLLVKLFVDRGMSLFILPFPVCLFTFWGYRFMISRRDAWMLILAYFLFRMYNEFIHSRSQRYLIGMNLLIVLGVLIHESFIIIAFPIVFFHFLYFQRHDHMIRSVLIWIPAILAPVAIICLGSRQAVPAITASWESLFTQNPLGEPFALDEIYYEYLTQSLSLNYIIDRLNTSWLSCGVWIIPRWVLNLYVFVAVYYLVTQLNIINLGWNKSKMIDSIQLSNIVIFQFLCILPDMLFMSDDMARNITNWVVTSLLFFVIFDSKVYSPDWMNRYSLRLQTYIHGNRFLSHPYAYLAILLTLPLEFHGGGIKMLIPIIPQELKHIARLLL